MNASLLASFLLLATSCSFMEKSRTSEEAASQAERELPELKADLPELPFFEGDLFLVFAHADDELQTLSHAIDLRKLNPKAAIHWILVTDSGKGFVAPDSCGLKSPRRCRADEVKRVALCANIPEPTQLGFADGSLGEPKELDARIGSAVKKLAKKGVGLVITHDPMGVYGHPDHLAVRDSVERLAALRGWRVASGAIPPAFREKIEMRHPAEGRSDEKVTHVRDLVDDTKKRLACAMKAHASQKLVLWMLRQKLTPEEYLDDIPRQFFHLD